MDNSFEGRRSVYLPELSDSNKKIITLMSNIKEKRSEFERKIFKTRTQSESDVQLRYRPYRNLPLKRRLLTIAPEKNYQTSVLKNVDRQAQTSNPSRLQKLLNQNQTSDKLIQNQEQSNNKTKRKQSYYKQKFKKPAQGFGLLLQKVPEQTNKRSQQNLDELKSFLIDNNIFFMKINPAITLCLLKVGKFHKYKKNQLIYTAFNHRKSFFIILKGKVKLLNLECETLKLCYPGETIAEQIVFEEAHKKKSMQHATACMSTYLLEMTQENYHKVCEEVLKCGYKTPFYEMESLIKRNYIQKNKLRRFGRRFSMKK